MQTNIPQSVAEFAERMTVAIREEIRKLRGEARYVPCDSFPVGVRMDEDRRTSGCHVVVSYGGYGRSEHGPGDLYRMTVDRSDGTVRREQLQPAIGPAVIDSLVVRVTSGRTAEWGEVILVARIGRVEISSDWLPTTGNDDLSTAKRMAARLIIKGGW